MVVGPGLRQDRVIKGKYWKPGMIGIGRMTSGKIGKVVECSGGKYRQNSTKKRGTYKLLTSPQSIKTLTWDFREDGNGFGITNSHRCSKKNQLEYLGIILDTEKSRFLDMVLIRFKNLKNQSFYHSRIHEILERYFGLAWTRKIDIQPSPRFRHPQWCQNIWVGGSNEKELTVFPGMQRLNFLWIPRTLLLPGEGVNVNKTKTWSGKPRTGRTAAWDSITANRDEIFPNFVRISR